MQVSIVSYMEPSITMVALLTDALAHRPLDDVAAWCAERGIGGLEIGVGGYSPAPHLDALPAELPVVAFNASGNVLHPDPAMAASHDQALRRALTLAAEHGVPRVVTMSGCPAAPAAAGPHLPLRRVAARHGAAVRRQMANDRPRLAPALRLAKEAPDVMVCLEMHPGRRSSTPRASRCCASVTGDNVRSTWTPAISGGRASTR